MLIYIFKYLISIHITQTFNNDWFKSLLKVWVNVAICACVCWCLMDLFKGRYVALLFLDKQPVLVQYCYCGPCAFCVGPMETAGMWMKG